MAVRVLARGRRKAVYAFSALAVLCAGAWRMSASYPEFRDAVIFWLGLVLGSHVAQEATAKHPPPEAG